MSKREYAWFLEPLDSHTNKVFSLQIPLDSFSKVLCGDGKIHNLWPCSPEKVSAFFRSREDLALRFKIFCREGHGKVRDGAFLFKRKKRMPSRKKANAA